MQSKKCKQWPETDAIRIKDPPSKPEWEISKITNKHKYKESILLAEWAAISQKMATQLPEPNLISSRHIECENSTETDSKKATQRITSPVPGMAGNIKITQGAIVLLLSNSPSTLLFLHAPHCEKKPVIRVSNQVRYKPVCPTSQIEQHQEKTCLWDFRPGLTQRKLYSHCPLKMARGLKFQI